MNEKSVQNVTSLTQSLINIWFNSKNTDRNDDYDDNTTTYNNEVKREEECNDE